MAIRKSSNSGIPFGNTSSRPSSPSTGQPYFNGELQRLELYTGATYGWQNIVAETPGVTGYTGAVLESNATNTILITGTNFAAGAIAYLIGNDGTEYIANSTTVNNLTQITAVFGSLPVNKEPYDIRVTNPSNLYGVYYDILTVNNLPVWNTAAGSLGTFTEQVSISVSATATDPDSTITYSLAAGSSLPSGLTLNSSTGSITGTLPNITSSTTYTFTINASDGTNPDQSRTFSITSNAIPEADFLVIAGGGGGGGGMDSYAGGGGGAGGYRTSYGTSGRGSSAESKLYFTSGATYTITVGGGGAGGAGSTSGTWNSADIGSPGTNSSISGTGITTITSTGGGYGGAGGEDSSTFGAGGNGGAGGGAGAKSGGSGSNWSGGTGTSGQGYDGGSGSNSSYVDSGSGGGAGGAGNNASLVASSDPITGGNGIASSITESSVIRAVGGAGADGASGSGSGTAGANNTGNGGQGGRRISNGATGGSGIVILRTNVIASATTGSPTYTNPSSGVYIYQFLNNGTITF